MALKQLEWLQTIMFSFYGALYTECTFVLEFLTMQLWQFITLKNVDFPWRFWYNGKNKHKISGITIFVFSFIKR